MSKKQTLTESLLAAISPTDPSHIKYGKSIRNNPRTAITSEERAKRKAAKQRAQASKRRNRG